MTLRHAIGAIFNLLVALGLAYLSWTGFSQGGSGIAMGLLMGMFAYFALLAAILIAVFGIRSKSNIPPPVIC